MFREKPTYRGWSLFGMFREKSKKRTMEEIIDTLWSMELSELRSSLEAVRDIAEAAKQEKSDNTDSLPPINLSCKQKLRIDVEFMQQHYIGLNEENTVNEFIEVWEARMEKREKRKKLWKPYENETQQLLEQSLAKINEINQENFQWLSFYNTTLGEKQCSDWLEAVRAPIARVKQHYSSLPDHSDQNYLKEVFCLHGYTLVAWLTVFKACQRVKTFSVQMKTDFLQRMLRNMVSVSDKLFHLLDQIDNVLRERRSFKFSLSDIVEPTEIMTLSDLREMRKSSDEDGAIEDPKVYWNRFINISDFI